MTDTGTQYVPPSYEPPGTTASQPQGGGSWMDRIVRSIVPQEGEGFFTLNPVKNLVNILGTPHSVVTSTGKELLDFARPPAAAGARVQPDNPSISDWWRQISEPHNRIGVGDLLSAPDKVAGFDNPFKPERINANPALRAASIAAGFVGDVGLDPLTFVGAPGARALAQGGRRQLAEIAASQPYVFALDVGARRGDDTAIRLSNQMHTASAKLNDAERAVRNATDLDARAAAIEARDTAREGVEALESQTSEWMKATGIGEELDRGIWNLAKPGGGAAELTDPDIAATLLRTDDPVTGLRLRPFWRTTGGLQLISPEVWQKVTAPVRQFRGDLGQTRPAKFVRSHYGSAKNARLIQLAADTAESGNPELFSRKLGFLEDTRAVDNRKTAWAENGRAQIRRLAGRQRWTEHQLDVLMDALETPVESWDVTKVGAKLTQLGVDREVVDSLRTLFQRWRQDGQAAGIEINDLGKVYMPIRLAEAQKRSAAGNESKAFQASFEQARWKGTEWMGHEVPTMHAMISAGVASVTDDGTVKLVKPDLFNWAGFKKDLQRIGSEVFGDAFDPDRYIKDPFRLADMYIGEMARRLQTKGYEAAALKNGLAVWHSEMTVGQELAELTRQANHVEVRKGEAAQAYANATEKMGAATDAWKSGPLYRREAEGVAVQREIIQGLKDFSAFVGRKKLPDNEKAAIQALRNFTKQIGRKKGGTKLTERQMEAANRFSELLDDADEASVLRGLAARKQAELFEAAEQQGRRVFESLFADPQIENVIQFAARIVNTSVEVSDELLAAVDGDDIGVALQGVEALGREWEGFLDEFTVLRDRLTSESAIQWQTELGAVEQMLLDYRSRLLGLADSVRADMAGVTIPAEEAIKRGLIEGPKQTPPGAMIVQREWPKASQFGKWFNNTDMSERLEVLSEMPAEFREAARRGDVNTLNSYWRGAKLPTTKKGVEEKVRAVLLGTEEAASYVQFDPSDGIGPLDIGDRFRKAVQAGPERRDDAWEWAYDEYMAWAPKDKTRGKERWTESWQEAAQKFATQIQREVEQGADTEARRLFEETLAGGRKPEPLPDVTVREISDEQLAERVRKSVAINSAERAAWERLAELDPYAAFSYGDETARTRFMVGENGEGLAQLRDQIDNQISTTGATPALNAALAETNEAISMIEQAGQVAKTLPMQERTKAAELLNISVNAATATGHRLARDKAVQKAWQQRTKTRDLQASYDAQLDNLEEGIQKLAVSEERLEKLRREAGYKLAQWGEIETHTDIADILNTTLSPTQLSRTLKAWSGFASYWRGMALLSPGYHTRNTISAVFSNAVAGVPLSLHKRTLRAYTRMVKQQPVQDVEMTNFLEESMAAGTFGHGQYGGEIAQVDVRDTSWNPLAGIGAGLASSQGRSPRQFKLVHGNRIAGNHIENVVRGAAGFHAASSIPAAGGAAARQSAARQFINRIHFDYTDLSNWEANYIRNVSMFYTWMSRNIVLQAEMAIARPQVYMATNRLFENIGAGAPVNPFAPEYYDENEYRQISQRWYSTLELPNLAAIKDVNRVTNIARGFTDPDVSLGQAVTRGVAEYSPFFREGLEFATGRDALRGYELKGSARWSRSLGSFFPLYAKVRRLAPSMVPGGTAGEQERILSNWMSFWGWPTRQVSMTEMRNVRRRREQEAAAKLAVARNDEQQERETQRQIDQANRAVERDLAAAT